MTTIGFKNIPFTVNVSMHAAIHANHQVLLNNGGDGRMTFPSGGTLMVFTPSNWNTPQPLVVNFNGVGDAELIAEITNDYFVNGAMEHRVKRDIIDLSITALPIDTWTGSVPRIGAGDGGGNLTIYHRALDTVHNASISITHVAGQLTSAGTVSHQVYLHVTKPDNTTVDVSAANTVGVALDQVGIWKFEVGADPGTIEEAFSGQYSIQSSTWTFTPDDGSTSPVTSSTVYHQGCTYVDASGFPTLPDGAFGPVVALTLDQNTCVSAPTFVPGSVTVQSNCTGCTMAATGSGITISGTRSNSPSAMSANGPFTVQSAGLPISGTQTAYVNG